MNVPMTIFFICGVQAYYEPSINSPNVGTVLFRRSDLNKKRWSEDKLKLLQARKHLQDIIPSTHLTNTINEEYLASLLSYFDESYYIIKREVEDLEINNVMNIALSDALGGFLKVWVLPITKYAYYGGTVSMEKAIHIFQVYEGIKRNLNTDGQSWRGPNENLLKSVAIDIISRPRSTLPRSMKDPCKKLAYYEKTDTDLTVPLPVINWDILPITIFVPLKNQSLVPISSVNSSKILFHYYDIAENCMQAQTPTSLNDFNQKFQRWLSKDIAPHLKDDNLYIAFGSILSLINDTKSIPGILSNSCNHNYDRDKSKGFENTMCKTSRKYLIIALIILVEVMWCLPSLFYIIRLRRRKRSGGEKKCFLGFFRKKPNDINKRCNNNQSKLFKYNYFSDSSHKDQQDHGVKLFFKPRARHLEVDVQHPSCDSKYMSIKSNESYKKNSSSGQITIAKEVPKKSSLKKILPEFETSFVACNSSKRKDIEIKDNNNATQEKSKSHNQINAEPTRTLTLIQDEQTIKEINYSQESSLQKSDNEESQLQCKCSLTDSSKKLLNRCACTPCLKSDVQTTVSKDKKLHNNLKSTFEKYKKNQKRIHRTVMHTEIDENLHRPKNIDRTDVAKNSVHFDKPLLRIRIDRPKTEINVGITSFREHCRKPSKIPRLAKQDVNKSELTDRKVDKPFEKSRKLKNSNLILRKNYLKKCTLDDTAIKRSTTTNKKLNVTL